jgi:hypothetical protein
LLGFLSVAWAFSSRHALAIGFFFADRESPAKDNLSRRRFSIFRSVLGVPFCLIVLMIGFFFAYSWLLEHSIMVAQVDGLRREGLIKPEMQDASPAAIMITAPDDKIPARSAILKQENYRIPYGTELISLYVAMFLCAELAFVFMALREYMQSVLRLSDEMIILEMTGTKT